ncbi:MAG: deoxyribodipyrimidine photo-lyase [Dokdonella sp.]|uniref:cryptochrome/photolyase family protein n=1 Tax=Dokdonella sp. TaxID=2291710 RepID=UPI003267849D
MSTAIVWFRRDLRLADNPALAAAITSHDAILPLFIHAPDEESPWAPGAASLWWLHASLTALDARLRKSGASLRIEKGPSLATLERLLKATGATAVYWNRLYDPAVIARDATIKQRLRDLGSDARSFNGALLVEPWAIETGDGNPYKVFTPFWRKARAGLEVRPTAAAPRKIAMMESSGGLALEALDLLPAIDWAGGMRDAWEPGEAGAAKLLRRFCGDHLADYAVERDIPSHAGTSRLSPHLHFGEISPMQIAWALQDASASTGGSGGGEPYLREIGWREFSHHLLFHFPQTPQENLNPRFTDFRWAEPDVAALHRWQRGQTGIPIVDAGMRELWSTGWMHNRVRMLVASFLTKNLRQHWSHGARWFWDTLVDADLANNTQGWQWTAGTGADAAPYFRVFNPVTQGARFDAKGDYVRQWVPELRNFAGKDIHQPWVDQARLQRSGYPAPMVDLATSRAQALAAYKKVSG